MPLGLFPFLAACEIAGAGGLLIGLWYPHRWASQPPSAWCSTLSARSAPPSQSDFKGLPNVAVMLLAAGAALTLGAISV